MPLNITKVLQQIVLYRRYFLKHCVPVVILDTESLAPMWDITEQPEKEKDEPHLDTRDASGPSKENHSP